MAKIDFPKKQEQRLIPKYLLEYSEELAKNHPDPSAEWGSSGPEYTAGNGIEINENTISIDDTVVATKNDIPDVSEFITDDDLSEVLEDYELKSEAFSGSYNDLTDKPTIPTKTSDLQNDSGFITGVTWNDVTGKPTFATVATSGDYDDLTDKPDLSVYELKEDAFSGDYTDLTNKPDLSVYELKTDAFSGNYNDLTNKPTIPTATSQLTNDSGFITGITSNMVTTALGYTPGTSNFSGDYDDLTDKPDLTVYELKTDAFSGDYNDLTNKPTLFSGSYNDLTNKPDLSIYAQTSSLGTAAFKNENALSIDYSQLTNTPTIPVVPTNVSAFTNDAGYITGIDSTDVINALGYTPGTSNFSGDYDDLTDKPTIPDAVSGTNDGTNWTSLTIGSTTYNIPAGSTPSNMVTTNTDQTITGVKTFKGSKKLLLKPGTSSDKPGFTTYLDASKELGFLESRTSDKLLTIGANINSSTGNTNNKVAFRYYSGSNNTTYNLIAPDGSSKYTAIGSGDKYIPIAFTNGTTTVESSAGGLVNLSSLMPTVPTVVDTVADGNMNAVTSNAVYDLVGDIETLLAAI